MEFPASFLAALQKVGSAEPTAKNIEKLSIEFGAEAARWAFSQRELRARARSKFSGADSMLFVREALEQASHERVASYHASQFPLGARVMDMTAGIGGDLIALSRTAEAVGYELDDERAYCLHWNLLAHKLSAEVRVEDSLVAIPNFDYALADPARRVGGIRTLRMNQFAPDPELIAAQMEKMRFGLIKLSPLLPDEALNSLGKRVEFVSWQGECREALVHCGAEALEGRWAVHLDSGLRLEAGGSPPRATSPQEFFFEADPAAIRARALGNLAHSFELKSLGEIPGYLTGAAEMSSPWLTPYRTISQLNYDLRMIKDEVVRLQGRVTAVKVRGVELKPEEVLAKMPKKGDVPFVIAIYREGSKPRVLLLARLT